MKQLLIELDDGTGRPGTLTPAISAIRRALWELEGQDTARAYQNQPDSGEDAYVDARVWAREDTRSLNDTDESSSKSES